MWDAVVMQKEQYKSCPSATQTAPVGQQTGDEEVVEKQSDGRLSSSLNEHKRRSLSMRRELHTTRETGRQTIAEGVEIRMRSQEISHMYKIQGRSLKKRLGRKEVRGKTLIRTPEEEMSSTDLRNSYLSMETMRGQVKENTSLVVLERGQLRKLRILQSILRNTAT